MLTAGKSYLFLSSAAIVAIAGGLALLPGKAQAELVIHCAAVLAGPVEELRPGYEQAHGVTLNISYDGSGALLARLRIPGTPGDVFISADRATMHDLESDGIATEARGIAGLKAVLVTRPGTTKSIHGLVDLCRDDIRVSLADPYTAAAGMLTRRVMSAHGMWDTFAARVSAGGVSYQGTVTKAAGDVAIGAADASVVWEPTARAAGLTMIHDPRLDANPEEAVAAVLSRSTRPHAARQFIQFLLESPESGAVFRRLGFTRVAADAR